jgi:hypothetical protein
MALKYAVNNSLSAITTLPSSISGGALNLISTQTASGSATIDFTSGIDSTYDSYVFKFINIHPATDGVNFHFQGSTNSGSTYGITTTTTAFRAAHNEAGADAFGYLTAQDLAQSTSNIFLLNGLGNENDQNLGGTLTLFNPSSTVFVKHFIARTQGNFNTDDYSLDFYSAGYFNTTSAINAVRFQMSSSNIDDGIIKMYGVS